MNIKLTKADDWSVIANMFQYYIYNMSEYTGFSPDANGSYAVDEKITGLYDYWKLADHYPFLIEADGEIAGFSLMRKFPENPEIYDIGQFFILRKFKGKGVGKKSFELSVKMFPGKWQTRVLLNNSGAKIFWTKVISGISKETPTTSIEKYKGKEMEFIYFSISKQESE